MIGVLGVLLTFLSAVSVYIGEVMLVRFVYKTEFAVSKSDFFSSDTSGGTVSSGASKVRAALRLLSTLISAALFYTLFSVISFAPAVDSSGLVAEEGIADTTQIAVPWIFFGAVAAALSVSVAFWFIGKGTFTGGVFHCCALFTSLIIYGEISSFLSGFMNLVDSPAFPYVAGLVSGLVPVIVFIPLSRASASEDQESWHKENALFVTAIDVFVHITAYAVGVILIVSGAVGGPYVMSLMMLSAAAVNTLTVCLGVILAKDRYYKRVTHINNEMLSAQASHYEAVKQSNFEIRRVKHDMKNHLLVIEELAKAQNYDELLKYTAELNQQITSADVFYRTGNDIADAILSDKNNKASLRGITLKVSGDLYGCTLNPADLCTVIGNLLDNAIEAVGGFYGLDTDEETRTVVFEMRRNNNFMLITETNYSPAPIIRKDNKIISSKNSDNHGFGIYNIKNVVAKYDGDFEIITEEADPAHAEYFKYSFEIMLPMK